eukprot:6492758-Amphidinium_carterae.3
MHELSVAYKHARQTQGAAWERVCQLADSVAHKSVKTQGAFGLVVRCIQRRHFESALEGLWSSISQLPLSAQTLEIKSFAAVSATRSPTCDAVHIARKLQGIANKQKHASKLQVEEELAAYQAQGGKELVGQLQANFPDLQAFDMRSVPSSRRMKSFEIAFDGTKAKNALAWIEAHHHSSMGPALSSAWDELHEVYDNAKLPVSETDTYEIHESSPCCLAGVCLCSARGKIWSGQRELIAWQCGVLFVQTHLSLAAHTKPSDGSAAAALRTLYLQIPLMYMNPIRPTFHLLEAILATALPDEMLGDTRIHVKVQAWGDKRSRFSAKATHKYYTEHEAFLLLDQGAAYTLQFFFIDDSSRSIPKLNPNIVVLKQQSGEVQFWPVLRSGPGKAVPHHVGWDLLLGNFSEQQADNDNDDDDGDAHHAAELEGSDAEEPGQDAATSLQQACVLQSEAFQFLREKRKSRKKQAKASSALPNAESSMAASASAPRAAAKVVAPQADVPAVTRGPNLGLRESALAYIEVAEGRISFYAAKGIFEAKCTCTSHNVPGTCKLTRTHNVRKKSRDGKSLGGRPVPFLLAWLRFSSNCAGKEEHWQRALWETQFPLASREACRRELQSSEAGRHLLAQERPLEDGEAEEPVTLDGMVY